MNVILAPVLIQSQLNSISCTTVNSHGFSDYKFDVVYVPCSIIIIIIIISVMIPEAL